MQNIYIYIYIRQKEGGVEFQGMGSDVWCKRTHDLASRDTLSQYRLSPLANLVNVG